MNGDELIQSLDKKTTNIENDLLVLIKEKGRRLSQKNKIKFIKIIRELLEDNIINTKDIDYDHKFYDNLDQALDYILKELDTVPTASDLFTYTHEQQQPASEWEIIHNLDRHPAVVVVDSAGSVVLGDIKYIDKNNVKIMFEGQFSGKAYLN